MHQEPQVANPNGKEFPPQPLGRLALQVGERGWLIGLLGLAFVLRCWNVYAMGGNPRFGAPVMDAGYHLDWARAIAAGDVFQEGAYFRAPLYPWFLAALWKITGGSLFAIRIVQAGLGTLTTYWTWKLGRHVFGRSTGWIAGVLAATNWILIYFDGELLIPTLYVPLLLWGLNGAMTLPQRGFGWRACAWVGLAFGLAAIARPNVLLFMPPLFFWVLWKAPAQRLRAGLALTLGTCLPIAPITVRNYVVSGEPVLIATQAGVNFWIGNNPTSDGMTAVVPGTRAGWWEGYEDSRRLARIEAGKDLTDSQISEHYMAKAWDWMRAHPGAAMRQMAWKLRLFFMDWELSNNQEIRFTSHRFNPLSYASVSFGVLLALGLVGMAYALRRRAAALFPLWGFFWIYTLGVVAFFVCSRFRVPVLPVLMVFAGYGLGEWWRWLRTRQWVPAGVALAAAGAIAWGSSRLPAALTTDDSLGLLSLGTYALEQGDLDTAEPLLEEALAQSNGNRHLRLIWGVLLEMRGQKESARRWWYETLQRYPDYVELREKLCNLENDLGHYAEAAQLAERGVEAAPSQLNLKYSLGRALYGLGRKQEALTQFDGILDLDPGYFLAGYSKGLVLLELGQRDAARKAWLSAQEHIDMANPDVAESLRQGLKSLGP